MHGIQKVRHIKEHFKSKDGKLFPVLERMELKLLVPQLDAERYFPMLCREIIGQQLAGKAARAIAARFAGLFPEDKAMPHSVLAIPEDALRATGMSWAKVRSVRDLASKVHRHELAFETFSKLDDEGVIAQLTNVRGIGRWTAEMFLMFTLGREDVFSHGDLGLQKGLTRIYGSPRTRTRQSISRITAQWAPYRSYGSMALWHVNDTENVE